MSTIRYVGCVGAIAVSLTAVDLGIARADDAYLSNTDDAYLRAAAPLYSVSVDAVVFDRTFFPPTHYPFISDGNPNNAAPVDGGAGDFDHISMNAVLGSASGQPVTLDQFGCSLGSGDGKRTATTCTADDSPYSNKPIAFGHAFAVNTSDKLYVNYALTAIDPRTDVTSAIDAQNARWANAGYYFGLTGNGVSELGQIVSVVTDDIKDIPPWGGYIQVIGGLFQVAGALLTAPTTAQPPAPNTASLLVGQGTLYAHWENPGGFPPTIVAADQTSADFAHFALDGKFLFDATASHDALLEYDFDGGLVHVLDPCDIQLNENVTPPWWKFDAALTRAGQCATQTAAETYWGHPHTTIRFRIHRIKATESPGTDTGMTVNPFPGLADAYAVDGSGNFLHQRFSGSPTYALSEGSDASVGWSNAEIPPDTTTTACNWIWIAGARYCLPTIKHRFAPNANVTALTFLDARAEEVFAVDATGTLVRQQQNFATPGVPSWSDAWVPVATYGELPPGAPIAAVKALTTNKPYYDELFVVANDGAVRWVHMNQQTSPPWTSIAAAGTVKPFDGTAGGGIAAVSRTDGTIDVFFADSTGQVQWLRGTQTDAQNDVWSWTPAGPVPGLRTVPGGNVAAVSRAIRSLDVFAIDGAGQILASRASWGIAGFNWRVGGLPIPRYDLVWGAAQITGSASARNFVPAVPGGAIAVVARRAAAPTSAGGSDAGYAGVVNDRLDVFTVGTAATPGGPGRVLHSSWAGDINGGSWPTYFDWAASSSLGNGTGANQVIGTVDATPGAPIAAFSPSPSSVYVVARRPAGLAKTWFDYREPNWQATSW